jgi:hypothetical protein
MRYRTNMYNLNYIRYLFGNHISLTLKKWIDTNYKIIKITTQLKFLKHCKTNNVYPIHLSSICQKKFNFDRHRSTQKLDKLLHNVRKGILNIEIYELHRYISFLTKERNLLTSSLENNLPSYIWYEIYGYHTTSFNNFYDKLQNAHVKKFNNLLQKTITNNIKKIKPIKYLCQTVANEPTINNNYSLETQSTIDNSKLINITIDPNKFLEPPKEPLSTTNNKWFLNLTQQSIPESVSNLVQLGEEFCLPISQNKKEVVHEFIKDVESNIIQKKIKKDTNIRNIVIPRLYKYLDSYTSKDSIDAKLISMSRSTSQFCKNNPNILFTRANKGNVVVALDRESYIEKMELTLNDISTYSKIKNNPSLKLEKNLNNVLKNWLQKDYIDKRKFHTLRASDCPLPKAYGLSKIHKNNFPYRISLLDWHSALSDGNFSTQNNI